MQQWFLQFGSKSMRSIIHPMNLRTVKFWVRLQPRTKRRHRTLVLHKIYRTQKDAKAACKKGEDIMQVKGHYWAGKMPPPGAKKRQQ